MQGIVGCGIWGFAIGVVLCALGLSKIPAYLFYAGAALLAIACILLRNKSDVVPKLLLFVCMLVTGAFVGGNYILPSLHR